MAFKRTKPSIQSSIDYYLKKSFWYLLQAIGSTPPREILCPEEILIVHVPVNPFEIRN